MKYVVITGGVISGLGKGVTASSLGFLLKNLGYDVTMIKIDPYINVDAGTMSPYEHGEVYVLNDGSETDLDLGNYERFLGITLTEKHNITTGKVYKSVIDDERAGKYLGKTVQIIPHITDKIYSCIKNAAHTPSDPTRTTQPDICIIEVGGTVGDFESMAFIEAIRQMKLKEEHMCFVHVSLVPIINGEQKTKPTQTGVKALRELGIFPNLMVLRMEKELEMEARKKISNYCQVPEGNIVVNKTVESIYHVPGMLRDQCVEAIITKTLGLIHVAVPMPEIIGNYISNCSSERILRIGIVGKYTKFTDAYLSITSAIRHAGCFKNVKVLPVWICSDNLVDLHLCHGFIIPGGFGSRGIEGMITLARHCRDHNIPLLGICLGMHVMCIEAGRRTLGENCHSEEFEPEIEHKVIKYIDKRETKMGGTMKLGTHTTILNDTMSKAWQIYGEHEVKERHRHRYEVNPEYYEALSKTLTLSGVSKTDSCVDIVEETRLMFYVGVQYHPEFNSTMVRPSKIFMNFVDSCIKKVGLYEA